MAIRFGLLGAGRIGKVHAKAVTGDAQARLVAVADADARRLVDALRNEKKKVRDVQEALEVIYRQVQQPR